MGDRRGRGRVRGLCTSSLRWHRYRYGSATGATSNSRSQHGVGNSDQLQGAAELREERADHRHPEPDRYPDEVVREVPAGQRAAERTAGLRPTRATRAERMEREGADRVDRMPTREEVGKIVANIPDRYR